MPVNEYEPVLRGKIRRPDTVLGANLRGWVRLEDVSAVDGPSVVLAEAAVRMRTDASYAAFELSLPRNIGGLARYSLAAELAGDGEKFGTVRSYPWRPDGPPQEITVDVVKWR